MSIQNSYLAQSKYGYDTVVAVTQKALNNTIETYYDNIASSKTPFTQQTCYFVKDGSGNPVAIDKASLLAKTNNVDPLTVQAWNGQGAMPADVSSVINSGFYFAFQFTPGDPKVINNYIYLTINPGTQSVIYYLLCTTLTIVFWDNSVNPNAWVNISQSQTRSKTPIEFNINAMIKLQNVLDNTNLPPAVQAEVNNLGNTDVNVQQLLLDFDSAVANPTTALPGLDPTGALFKPIMQQFAAAYFAAYAAVEVPRLNYAITQTNSSTLVPTAMEFYAGALVDNNGNAVPVSKDDAVADLATINYLFSVNGNALPAPAQFNWNWLEDNGVSPTPGTDINADVNKYSGAIAIKRDAFAKFLESNLTPYALQNCWSPIVVNEPLQNNDVFLVNFDQGKLLAEPFQAYSPFNGPSDQLLSYWFEGSTTAKGTVYTGDFMTVIAHFDMFAIVTDAKTLTITQHLFLEINAEINWNKYSGNPIDKSYTDVFNIVIDDNGNIIFQKNAAQSTSADNSVAVNLPSPQGGWIESFIESLSVSTFTDVPATMPKTFVFPGGNAFTFKDAQFSDCSDLVCHVTYLSES